MNPKDLTDLELRRGIAEAMKLDVRVYPPRVECLYAWNAEYTKHFEVPDYVNDFQEINKIERELDNSTLIRYRNVLIIQLGSSDRAVIASCRERAVALYTTFTLPLS